MADRVGQQFGNYRLLRLIGRGSMADVYLGEHRHLGTQAAIKILHTALTSEGSSQLYAEARTLARFLHPHIVRIFDFDIIDDIPFLVMQYAPESFRQRYPKRRPLPLLDMVSSIKQVAEGLHYAHEQGVIHRDVRPENLLIGHNQEVLLTDFGLAVIVQSTRSQPTMEVAGTVVYMAPEQLQGKPRPASDQYALAVVAYEWLTGEPPFSGSIREIANQHLSSPPPPLRSRVRELPAVVEQVILKALDKDPKQRFEHVQAFAEALQEAYHLDARGQAAYIPAAESAKTSSSLHHLPTGTVTLLFTDIEQSTDLLRRSGDRYAAILADFRQVLRTTLRQWSGHEVDTQGDAFFFAFARASNAVAAAVDVQRALATHTFPESASVRIRIGVHTGEPSVTDEGYIGLDVHRAARIMSIGHGGQVLLSHTTAHLVEQELPEDVSLRDLGEHRLKDLTRKRRLYQLVIWDLPADFPPLKTLDALPNNLPVQFTPFFGRVQELASLQRLLLREEVRLVTLTGPGGTGKTRLALQGAAEVSDTFADGSWFVNLAPLSDPAMVMSTIAETLGIREGTDQALLERLRGYLRQKQLLLLLDNFEQVVSAAGQIMDLLTTCPRLKILVTSREVLHVRAEYEFPVPPLELPDLKRLTDLATLSHNAAVALFVQRAQTTKPDFQMTVTNARAITEICVRLDGLPLAIELAAARVKVLPPQALLARLGHRFDMLTTRAQDVPARQQTLRNTIAWSYNLLNTDEQRLFRRIPVFVGGGTLEALEAVYEAVGEKNENLLDDLAALVDKSLLQQIDQEGEEPRFNMLETICEYAWEELAASGEAEIIQHAYASFYLALAEEAELEFKGPHQGLTAMHLKRERENLRTALFWLIEHGEREKALRLSAALWRFWRMRGPLQEGLDWLEKALEDSSNVWIAVRAKALYAAGELALLLGKEDQASTWGEESLLLYQQLADKRGTAASLLILGQVAAAKGNFAAALVFHEKSLACYREMEDRDGIADSLVRQGWLSCRIGDLSKAAEQLEEGLELFRDLGHSEGIASVLASLARVTSLQGDYVRAQSLAQESLGLSQKLNDRGGIGDSLFYLAQVALWQGNMGAASALLEESVTLLRGVDEKLTFAAPLALLGEVNLHQGEIITARSLIEESVALFKQEGSRRFMDWPLSLLAQLEARQGNYAAARALYEESLDISIRMCNKLNIVSCLEGLASVITAQGEPTIAAKMWGTAEILRGSIGAPLPPLYHSDYEQSVTAARIQMGEQSFTAAWTEGRAMTPEQALAAQGPIPMPAPVPTKTISAPPARTSVMYPDGLTAREVEVLRLAAQGLADAQIAERLVISPRTVNNHLTSIYSKIQVSSRVAATRYALEHDLA